MPVLEGPGAQEREGEAGVQEALLRGGLASYRERSRSCRGHVHVQPLQTGPAHPAESQLQPQRTQQRGKMSFTGKCILDHSLSSKSTDICVEKEMQKNKSE